MDKLLELKKKAIDAQNAYYAFDETIEEWSSILNNSDGLSKILNLDISADSKKFFKNLTNVSATLNKMLTELEVKNNEATLEYALFLFGGKLGDVVDYIDNSGRNCAIKVESAHMFGDGAAIYGTRVLKSGCLGVKQDSVNLNNKNWKIRK